MPAPQDITALILAGGFGTRVKDLLGDLPKPMAPVKGCPFVEWIVRWLKAQGVRDVILSTGFRAELVEEHFSTTPVPEMNVRCVTEPEPMGTGGGLDLYSAPDRQAATSFDVGDLVLLEEVAHPFGQFFRNRPATLLSRPEVHVRLGERDTMRLRRLEFVGQGRAGQEGFGGNTSYVETNTSQLMSLDTSHAQSELRPSDSCNVTSGASTYDEYIKVVSCHTFTSFEAVRSLQGGR